MRPKFYREKHQVPQQQDSKGMTEEKRAKLEAEISDNKEVDRETVQEESGDEAAMQRAEDEAVMFNKKRRVLVDLRKKRVTELGVEGRNKEALSSSSSPQSFSSSTSNSPLTVGDKGSSDPDREVDEVDPEEERNPPRLASSDDPPLSTQTEAYQGIPLITKGSPSLTSPPQPPVIPDVIPPWGLHPGPPGLYANPLVRPPIAGSYSASAFDKNQMSSRTMPYFPGMPPMQGMRFPPGNIPLMSPGQHPQPHPANLLLDFSGRTNSMGSSAAGASTRSPPDPAHSPEPGTSRRRSHPLEPHPRRPDPMMSLETRSEPSSPTSSTSSPERSRPDSAKKEKGGGQPYIPSYMDLTNGPEPCVVCSDAATGYHYRCMTCEGCKGFFRRTIQKNLQYHCKWNNNCVIDKNTRNQCQQCRFKKCVAVGMATDLVLNDKQRVAKRRLIEENRERRKQETTKLKLKHEQCYHDFLTDEDRALIDDILNAYEQTGVNTPKTWTIPEKDSSQEPLDPTGTQRTDPEVWQQLAEVMTPSIVKVVEFSKRVPGFVNLNVDDQILLLKSCCMEIMCLRAACKYDPGSNTLTLHNGLTLTKNQLGHGGLGMLVEPIFEFATGLAKLQLDETEMALLASVLLMQSDRTGLREPEAVEKVQDAILGAYKRYIADKRPSQPVHWAKILMKVTDLRTISTRHAERVLCIKLDSPGDIPPLFLEMFDEAPPVILLQLLMNVPPPPPPQFTVL